MVVTPIQLVQSTVCIGKQAHQFLVHFQRRDRRQGEISNRIKDWNQDGFKE